MKFSTLGIVRSIALAGAASALVLSVSACGDMLTFARESKLTGIRQYNDGRYADAAGSFQNASRQDPADPETEYYLGLSDEQNKSYHQAIDAYKTALILMPQPGTARYDGALHDNAFDRLARVVARNDATGAESELIAKSADERKSAEQYRLLGRIFRYRGDADSSVDYYHRAVALAPADFASQKELGLYLEQLGQNQDAAVALRDAYRLHQNDKEINDALRNIGMEPGTNLLVESAPAKPVAPSTPSDGWSIPAAIKTGPQDTFAPRE